MNRAFLLAVCFLHRWIGSFGATKSSLCSFSIVRDHPFRSQLSCCPLCAATQGLLYEAETAAATAQQQAVTQVIGRHQPSSVCVLSCRRRRGQFSLCALMPFLAGIG